MVGKHGKLYNKEGETLISPLYYFSPTVPAIGNIMSHIYHIATVSYK